MKSNLKRFVFLAILLSSPVLLASNWIHSFEEAQKIALSTNKLILVDFWATWCGPCKRMDSESWSKDDVKQLLDNYVPLKIDIDRQISFANQYGVRGIPYIFILDGNGKVIYQQMSYKSKNEIMALLKKYALNTYLLSLDLINYYKYPSFSSSYRLAAKYQDFSLKLDESLKPDFLNLAESYFNEAEKFLKDSEMKDKDVFAQKMELFHVQHFLILKNTKRAEKVLEKLESASIHSSNQDFYTFLKYLSQKIQGFDNPELLSSLSETYKNKVSLFPS